jgi:hypothetical protein
MIFISKIIAVMLLRIVATLKINFIISEPKHKIIGGVVRNQRVF